MCLKQRPCQLSSTQLASCDRKQAVWYHIVDGDGERKPVKEKKSNALKFLSSHFTGDTVLVCSCMVQNIKHGPLFSQQNCQVSQTMTSAESNTQLHSDNKIIYSYKT